MKRIITFVLCGAASLSLWGCRAPVDDNALLNSAELLVLERNFDEAEVLLKSYLTRNPNDAGAHYYLGKCYLVADDFWPDLAEGEFQTALALFRAQGNTSSIERFSDHYFELICIIDSAKVHVERANVMIQNRAPKSSVYRIIRKSEAYADEARLVAPGSDEVAWLDSINQTLRAVLQGVKLPPNYDPRPLGRDPIEV